MPKLHWISVYNSLRSSSSFQRQIILAAEYPGEATWNNNSGEAWRTEMDQFTWTTSSTGFYQIWSQLYVTINRANTVLSYLKIQSSRIPVQRRRQLGKHVFCVGLLIFI